MELIALLEPVYAVSRILAGLRCHGTVWVLVGVVSADSSMECKLQQKEGKGGQRFEATCGE